MNFRLEPYGQGNKADFLKYCARHGNEHDESYVPDADFAGKREQPSFVLRDEQGSIVAVLSLMLSASMLASGRIRIAILHASISDPTGRPRPPTRGRAWAFISFSPPNCPFSASSCLNPVLSWKG
jgi:hypothetical protein